jgi:hypothetical protein
LAFLSLLERSACRMYLTRRTRTMKSLYKPPCWVEVDLAQQHCLGFWSLLHNQKFRLPLSCLMHVATCFCHFLWMPWIHLELWRFRSDYTLYRHTCTELGIRCIRFAFLGLRL